MGILDRIQNLLSGSQTSDNLYSKISSHDILNNDSSSSADYIPIKKSSKKLLDFMDGFHFTDSILTILTSTVTDLLNKSSFYVKVRDVKGKTMEKEEVSVNEFIKNIGLRKVVLTDIKEHLYYGQMSYFIDRDNNKIYRLTHPHEGTIIRHQNDILGLKTDEEDGVDKDLLRSPFFMCYFRDPMVVTRIGKGDIKNDRILQHLEISEKTPSYVSLLEGIQGKGILDPIIYRAFQLYLREFELDLLGMKETFRQEIVTAEIASTVKDQNKVIEAISDIEASLNFSDFNYSITNPEESLRKILYYFKNSVKVVPQYQTIAGFNPLQRTEVTEKKEKITREIEELRREILNDLGIPEELFSGSSNRWETISRSSRFLVLINSILETEVDMIKRLAMDFISTTKNLEVTKGMYIEMTLNNSNVLMNNTMSNQATMLEEKIRAYANILGAFGEMTDKSVVDPQQLLRYLKEQLSLIDPESADFLLDKFVKSDDGY